MPADVLRFTMVRPLEPSNGCCTGLLTELIILLVILLHVRRGVASEWPVPDVFYDTKVIPEDNEVTAYLFRNEIESVFFLPDDETPVSISVIPCASALEWNVTYSTFNKSDRGERPYYNHTGAGKHTFTLSGKLIFKISLRPLTSDTRVHFLATKQVNSVAYPALPKDYKVEGAEVQRRRISVSWKASPEETPYDNIITYCVAISRGRSYPTHCSLNAHLYGDSYMKPPVGAGFGFAKEKKRFREMERKARPVKAAKRGQIVYKCIGSRTNYIYTRAKPNTRYYIDVYVINNNTNRTSAYTGLELKTMRGKKVKNLKFNKVNKVTLSRPKQKEGLKFKLTTFTSKVFLAIHACRGKVKFQVMRRGKTIVNTRIRNIKKMTLRDLEPDDYLVKITNSRKGRRNVRVFISNSTKVFQQYPDLPNDTRILVFDEQITCSNVTIAWLEAGERQTYCLYKKEIPASTKRKRRRNKTDSCKTSSVKSSEKIICKKFSRRHRNTNTGVTTYEITGLKPDTTYQFDILVSRRKRHSLPYQSVVTQTRTGC
ncbi:protein NDNF-like isoform X1 [Pecten maximus]|uniref:protein NDNF-like isoform X1 n=2 Tax=Pecten maximus TaxID=6579 RepID=UPI0014588D1E|nr:protein NDNF-like isoform X1 [Pecten maximus]